MGRGAELLSAPGAADAPGRPDGGGHLRRRTGAPGRLPALASMGRDRPRRQRRHPRQWLVRDGRARSTACSEISGAMIRTVMLIPLRDNRGRPFKKAAFKQLETRLLQFGGLSMLPEVSGIWRVGNRTYRDR